MMASKTFEEILNNASPEDKAAIDKTKDLAPQGKEADSIDAPTSVPNKTADASPEKGYNVDHLDAQAGAEGQKGNSATMSEVSNKPTTQDTPQPTPEPDKDR